MRPLHSGLVLLAVLALKQGYSLAGAEQLQWMLVPLVEVLEAIGGLSFEPQPGGDWLDAGHRVILVKACAGGNFLLTVSLAYLWRWRHQASALRTVLIAAGAAWVTTLAANALRILLAVHGQDALARVGGLTPADSHRLVGIGVYFLGLWVVLARPGRLGAALIVATGLYLGVNLLLPALRAGLLGLPAPDLEHVLWTAGVPLALIAFSLLFRRVGGGRRSSSCARRGLAGGRWPRRPALHRIATPSRLGLGRVDGLQRPTA